MSLRTFNENTVRILKVFSVGVSVITAIIIITTVSLTKCNRQEDSIRNYKAVISATIINKSDKWNVYKAYNEQLVIIELNNKIKDKKPFDVKKTEKKPLKLPDLKNVHAKNITVGVQYTKMTWTATLDESASQVKWFYEYGYTEVFRAETQEFIEIYLKDSQNQFKRLIITENQIAIADVKSFKFEDINDYVY